MRSILEAWATSLAFDLGRYAVVCVPLYLVFHVWLHGRLRERRLQPTRARTSAVWRELRYSLSTALLFSLVGAGVYFGSRAGIFRVYRDVSERGVAYAIVSVLVLIVLQDAYFYFMHRAMHHPRLFARVHRVHHLSTSPSPLTAYAFSPVEALVHAAFVPLVTLVVPVHELALFAFLGFMIARNAVGHLGVELFPRGFAASRLFGWSTTTTHHDLHHQHFRANYGLYFTLWDRVLGTTHPDYDATFERVTERSRGTRASSFAR